MRRTPVLVRALGWIAAAALAWPPGEPPAGAPSALAPRLLGPISSLAASVEWVRFDLAWRRGRTEEAYARAERALELDPRSESGWIAFGLHLAFDRASASAEPYPRRRRAWIEEGLAVLRRGEARARDPGELLFVRGLVLSHVGRLCLTESGGPDWPGGTRAAWEEGLAAFRAAERGGNALAGEQARSLDRALAELER